MNFNQSTLRLFNAIQIDTSLINSQEKVDPSTYQKVLKRTIRNGYLLDHKIIMIDKYEFLNEVLGEIEQVVGISGEKINKSFHKSWRKIQDADIKELILEQILHYFTTYGYEALGISDSKVFIPKEKLKIPKIDLEKISLTFVKGLTKMEVKEELLKLISSGIAFSKQTLLDIMNIIEFNNFKNSDEIISFTKNRELLSLLYDFYNKVPQNPTEFLRFLIKKLTGETLIIKNRRLVGMLKESENVCLLENLLEKAPKNLASIFYRFKPLFLALKQTDKSKTFINRLRKKAKKLHKPLPVDYLNSITGQIKKNTLDLEILKAELKKATSFRKIRLLYALRYRMNKNVSAIVYKIRNGSSFADVFKWESERKDLTKKAYNCVYDSLIETLRQKVKGKTFFIPKFINYALPATEKQFIGNLPSGTSLTINKDAIVGIYWENVKQENEERRTDLDLSATNLDGKIGWDSDYRNKESSILFSGDMTDAQNGASELFYFKNGLFKNIFLLNVNYYNFNQNAPVPTKLIIAKEKPKNFKKNYMVNPNNILIQENIVVDSEEVSFCLIKPIEDGRIKIFFNSTQTSKNITASSGRNDEILKRKIEFYENSLTKPINFKKMLKRAEAIIISEKPVEKNIEFIDFSPEQIDKASFLKLIGD